MKYRAISLFTALLLLLSVLAAPSQAQDRAQDIRQLLEQRDRQIKSMLGTKSTFTPEQRERLKDLVNDAIDFKAMSQEALGPHWATLTPQQRAEFTEVFSEIVRSQSLSNLDVYRAKVTYDTITVKGNEALVVTTTLYKDVPTKVAYQLGYQDGAWRVHDIILDDVSTAEGYARSFQTVIRKKGFDALMTSLHKKLDKIQASS